MSKQDVFPESTACGAESGVHLGQTDQKSENYDLKMEVQKLQSERDMLERELHEALAKIKALEGQHKKVSKRLDYMEEVIRAALV